MTAGEVVGFFEDYAESFDAPVRDFTAVRRVAPCGDLFVVETDDGPFLARNVVIATGWCDRGTRCRRWRRTCRAASTRSCPSRYKNPDDLPAGGVLVVGASATGVQLAQELHLSGRPVTLAVGTHSRMPRTLPRHGLVLVARPARRARPHDRRGRRSRRRPPRTVAAAGRLTRGVDTRPGDAAVDRRPPRRTPAGDRRRTRHVRTQRQRRRRRHRPPHAPRPRPRRRRRRAPVAERRDARSRPAWARGAGRRPSTSLDLHAAGITSIVWATGYRRRYDWLDLPILDQRGEIAQYRGVTPMPGATCSASASSTTAARTSSTASAATRSPSPSTSPPHPPVASCSHPHPPQSTDTREDRHVPAPHHTLPPQRRRLRRDRRRRPRRRRRHRHAARPQRPRRARPRAWRVRRRHAVDPRHHARRHPAAVPMGRARRDRRRRHAAGEAHHVLVQRRPGRDRHQALARRRRPLRAVPDGARPRARAGPPPMPARRSITARRSTACCGAAIASSACTPRPRTAAASSCSPRW